MQVLEKGEYVGGVIREIRDEQMLASVSTYDCSLFNDAWHCHVNAHISFVLNGGCSEKKQSSYERLPGKATFYMPGEPHQIINMQNSTHINLEMDNAFFQQYGLKEESFAAMINKTPDAKFLMLQVFQELGADDTFTGTSIHMLLLHYLRQAKLWESDKKMPPWIYTIHSLLHDRWNENLQLSDLSAESGVHPGTISHYFPKYFSCTLGAYMRKLKVDRALYLIKSSEMTLTEIALECGFFDQSHFIKTFKQLTGYLPAQYRTL
ncbi:MAG TPA: AraC family transcriptional regulator [Pedobacter sp.]|uniref:AraC family transcriptional regulator n=1 Tax=Pedobacter sp. TaxID=1411316 RepID=UPI002B7221DC|nr:AraC family transcriptional regulator [Pedobacter sp.]HMI04853.1 AraC family transcriptional regulator [Pedobacter sp.]